MARRRMSRAFFGFADGEDADTGRSEQLKFATAALADPRKTDAAAAEKLIATSRPIYYFNAALHSDETGSTESVLESSPTA